MALKKGQNSKQLRAEPQSNDHETENGPEGHYINRLEATKKERPQREALKNMKRFS